MIDHGIAFDFCSNLPCTQMTSFPFGLLLSIGLLVIMTVYVVARILSSSFEYLFNHLYNSSIVTVRSKDSEWKKGVDEQKLLLKF